MAPRPAPTPSEIIAALYALSGRSRFSSDANLRHCALYQARALAPLLDAFAFTDAPPHPYSPLFDAAVALLALTRILRRSGDLDEHVLGDASRRYVEREILPKFTDAERRALAAAAAVYAIACARD